MKWLAIGALIIAVVVLVPIMIIWSINTLFSLDIPTTLKTCVAALLLTIAVSGSGSNGKGSK